MLKQDNAYLNIELKGDIFKEINDQYNMEQERMRAGDKMLASKMGDIYKDVFKCNENITLTKSECFGNIIIDDNHIVVEWDIDGCVVEFYYEQYWDLMNLTIGLSGCEKALDEIAKAFQNYYMREFKYSVEKKENTMPGYDGSSITYLRYNLIIEDL
ncbi:MAG: hypothetical protein J6A59_03555 [Lachnospiraceae bacterium]|nr:hypothetical protein [Lachnospiraceae bacterium]